jgi:hypothetical protein
MLLPVSERVSFGIMIGAFESEARWAPKVRFKIKAVPVESLH